MFTSPITRPRSCYSQGVPTSKNHYAEFMTGSTGGRIGGAALRTIGLSGGGAVALDIQVHMKLRLHIYDPFLGRVMRQPIPDVSL